MERPAWWYEKVRATLNFLANRKRSYQLAFGSPAGKEVLTDLAKFCRANETCVVAGDRDLSLVLEGRREVFLRITKHLSLTPEQLVDLFDAGRTVSPPDNEQ